MSISYPRISVKTNSSDEDIRNELRKNIDNSGYATTVCRRCGVYIASPDGDSRTCPITDGCRHCNVPV